MTKVIILGETEKQEKPLTPIQFARILKEDGCFEDYPSLKPKDFLNIELISIKYTEDDLDLMFAYNETRSGNDFCCLYLGHFNDGVV